MLYWLTDVLMNALLTDWCIDECFIDWLMYWWIYMMNDVLNFWCIAKLLMTFCFWFYANLMGWFLMKWLDDFWNDWILFEHFLMKGLVSKQPLNCTKEHKHIKLKLFLAQPDWMYKKTILELTNWHKIIFRTSRPDINKPILNWHKTILALASQTRLKPILIELTQNHFATNKLT
jgi:hypothetical protein